MNSGPDLGLRDLFHHIGEHPDGSFVLATVTATEGSTYRKPGAMVLLTQDDRAIGLVSGGCLESDLCERAAPVLIDGRARLIEYDLRDDDPLWGLGLGCRGRLELLLELARKENGYAGLGEIEPHWRAHRRIDLLKTVRSDREPAPGDRWLLGPDENVPVEGIESEEPMPGGCTRLRREKAEFIRIPVYPPPRLLVCGAGPDAMPLARVANMIGWEVFVYDHRPAYAKSEHFPGAIRVICETAESLRHQPWLGEIDAAVVMSHHQQSDLSYVRTLSRARAGYVGLLGPAARGEELLAAAEVADRSAFFFPAGLDIGSDTPETIALSILAEAHAILRGRDGRSLRERA